MMTVIVKYQTPAAELAVGRATSEGTTVELERVVESTADTVGYFWFDGEDPERFERDLTEQAVVREASVTAENAAESLGRGEYRLRGDALLREILEHGGTVVEATGDDERWNLTVSFSERGEFATFQNEVVRDNQPIDLMEVYDGQQTEESDVDLTDRQRETLVAAYREGYFDIPRKVTLVDLADSLGVSDQAVSERLRRGEAKLVREHLFED